MNPPRHVDVGPYRFTIICTVAAWSPMQDANVLDPDPMRAYGFCDKRTCTIWLNPHVSPEFQREALLHELMHAVQFTAGLPNSTPIALEDGITRMSPLLLDVLRRNRTLRAYLFDG